MMMMDLNRGSYLLHKYNGKTISLSVIYSTQDLSATCFYFLFLDDAVHYINTRVSMMSSIISKKIIMKGMQMYSRNDRK